MIEKENIEEDKNNNVLHSYKSCRIINGQPKWIYFDEKKKIIKNPTKEQRKLAENFRYNPGDTCDCGCKRKLKPGKAYKERDINSSLTGRFLHINCWQKFDHNSSHSIIKSLRDSRTGKLDPNSTKAKGDIFQLITCKVRKVKDLNIENDNFCSPIDHSIDQELGIIQSKGAILSIKFTGTLKYECWEFDTINECKKEFDNLLAYCMDKTNKNVIRLYIFPMNEVVMWTHISIYKNPRGIPWYEKYRIKDIDQYNDAYNEIYLQNLETKKNQI